ESARSVRHSQAGHRFRTAFTLSMACAALVLLAIIAGRHTRDQKPIEPAEQVVASELLPDAPSTPVGRAQIAGPVKRVVKRAHHRKPPNDFAHAIVPLLTRHSTNS